VAIGNQPRQVVPAETDDPSSVTIQVPFPPTAGPWPVDPQPVSITVGTATDAPAGVKLAIVPDTPVIESLSRIQVSVGAELSVQGHWFLPPQGAAPHQAKPVVRLVNASDPGDTEICKPTGHVTDSNLTIQIPDDLVGEGETQDFKVLVVRSGPAATSNSLQVAVVGPPPLEAPKA
jgi:hypothetical protein